MVDLLFASCVDNLVFRDGRHASTSVENIDLEERRQAQGRAPMDIAVRPLFFSDVYESHCFRTSLPLCCGFNTYHCVIALAMVKFFGGWESRTLHGAISAIRHMGTNYISSNEKHSSQPEWMTYSTGYTVIATCRMGAKKKK